MAIYFCCYSSCKRLLNERNGTGKILSNFVPDSAAVHMLSAFSAGKTLFLNVSVKT